MGPEFSGAASKGKGRRFRIREVAGIALVMAIFVVGVSAFGVGKLQASTGVSWSHAFLRNLRAIAPMAIAVMAVMIFASRRQRDGMPEVLWVHGADADARPQTYILARGYRWLTLAVLVCMALASPLALYQAMYEDWGVRLFIGIWVVLVAVGVNYRLTREPEMLTLTADGILRVESSPFGRRSWDIPVNAIEEIHWPTASGYVTLVHGASALSVL